MTDDPYKVLGVARNASQDEIRKAYRKLAKDLHPDLHPGDKVAENRFKAVSAAYHLLSDPERRARYDRGEIDASGAEQPQRPFYRDFADAGQARRYTSDAGAGFADFSDLFTDFFGGRRGSEQMFRARGEDRRYQLEIDFLEAAKGASHRITLPNGNTLDLKIPAGTRDGGVLRLKGKGAPGMGRGASGDAFIEVAVRPHPLFRRDGNDIEIDLPVALDEAVLGAKVEVPTISGRVAMTVPRGSNTGDVLRLRGKGIAPVGGRAGDQRVVLKVVLPDKIDQDLESFLRRWREAHRYDPRRKLKTTTAA